MISFILNNQQVTVDKAFGGSLLDFIRYDQNLLGTKIGCREGDCGACTVLEGTLDNRKVTYKSIVSCLTPIGNVHGKHIVTIEGINMGHLSPVQKAFVDNAATQCGFCTPGFVMSLTAHSLSKEKSTKEKSIASISGNICRCTGYKSIERAAKAITEILKDKDIKDPIGWLVENNHLPAYFIGIHKRLEKFDKEQPVFKVDSTIIAGGTDLMVQRAEELVESDVNLFSNRLDLKGVTFENGKCTIGASTTASEIEQSSIIMDVIPEITPYFSLISSEPIRNMGTIAGNIVNASPIGDLSIMFLALNAEVNLNYRTIPLKEFFLGYKKLNINKDEHVKSIAIPIPKKTSLFNFEKGSKRTYLDIATVNSAIQIGLKDEIVVDCYLSAGGVSPIPLFLSKTCDFLKGKSITSETILRANEVLQTEISPISDVRGSIEYKRLLLRQLFFAHFIKLFPNKLNLKDLTNLKYHE
jgi:xanthine dehydrogenase small subunit